MIQTERNLTDIINNEALDYALYTVQNRAIPSLIDGFKPSQRFIVCRALELDKGNKGKFHKLASVAGGVADLGYHHGEASAQEAGALMASDWKNNFPLLDGDGNFGSRLVQEAAASRYVFCRISENFRSVYKDLDICPEHEDVEHIPPKFYLPIIPTVLLNGVSGVATGYSTNILPHSFKSVVECTLKALKGELNEEPVVEFPKFKGNIIPLDDGYSLEGTYEFSKGTKTKLEITEVPYKWDRAKYVEKVLDPLEDCGDISYDDKCSKHGFGFKVTLKKDLLSKLMTNDKAKHEKIMDEFKLRQKVSQNIVVTNENGKLMEFEKASDLIKYFVEIRKQYIDKRIKHMIIKSNHKFKLSKAKAMFISDVIKGNIVIQGKTKATISKELEGLEHYKEYTQELLSMNLYHITSDEAKKLALIAKEAKDELSYWENTTAIKEYTNDLEQLIIS